MALAGNESENLDHPWLLITDRAKKKEKQYLYSISHDRFHPVHIPEFHEMIVLASAYGWIVLAHPKMDNCFIWNPSSMQRIEIGILKYAFLFRTCVMSVSPSEPGYCHILFYNSQRYWRNPCLLKDGEIFVLPSYSPYHQYGDMCHTKVMAASAFQGKIYCVLKPKKMKRKRSRRKPKKRKSRNSKRKRKPGNRRKRKRKRKPGNRRKIYRAQGLHFASFDFDGKSLKFSPIFRYDIIGDRHWYVPKPRQLIDWDVYMIESPCGQELLLVQKIFMCPLVWEELMEFKVFRVNIDERECEELENIGDRAIFLSNDGSCFCCFSASSHGLYRRNCIYYTIPGKASRCVFVYDLANGKTTSVLPCPATKRSRSMTNWIDKTIANDQVCLGPSLNHFGSS